MKVTHYMIFKGNETRQLDIHGKPARQDSWYYEPADYEGDILWSNPFKTKKEVLQAIKDLD